MTAEQLYVWLIEQLVEAEPVNRPSTLSDPRRVAVSATKRLGRLGLCGGDLYHRSTQVTTAHECASVLMDCLKALPDAIPIDRDILTVREAARALHVRTECIEHWIEFGGLEATNLGTTNSPRWRIMRDDLHAFLKSKSTQKVPSEPLA